MGVATPCEQVQFHDETPPVFTTGDGITEEVVRTISRVKHEPEWMLDFRLKAFRIFRKMKKPAYGPSLAELDFEKINYFIRSSDTVKNNWEEVPDEIRDTFERIGIPQAEEQYLAGVATQYESEVVYHNIREEFTNLGIIFTDIDTALKEYPELFREYFATLVSPADNKLAALNSAVWSGGSFIYVPKGVCTDIPIQSYYRMNSGNTGQFERTLIIVDEGASINYVEGCTAPKHSTDSLHAAVVEVFVKKGASCRYTTIQNWTTNVYSLETKRSQVLADGMMEWVDANFGSKVTMKYPSVYLDGPGARGTMLSIAVAGANSVLDNGGRMIHRAPHTSSVIISKSIAQKGGQVNYRGEVLFKERSENSRSRVECDTILVDDLSQSDTIPFNQVQNKRIALEHEAQVSKVSEEQLFYLMSRGIPEKAAIEMIVLGFLEPLAKELPMEYAVELNRLIRYEMAGAIG